MDINNMLWITHSFDACWVIALSSSAQPNELSHLASCTPALLFFICALHLACHLPWLQPTLFKCWKFWLSCLSIFWPSLPQGNSTVSLYCHGSPQCEDPGLLSLALPGWMALVQFCSMVASLSTYFCSSALPLELNVPKSVLLIFSTLPLLWFLLLEWVSVLGSAFQSTFFLDLQPALV